MDMGFTLDASKRAAYNTREANNAEVSINWALTHMEDADFNDPFQVPAQQPPVIAPATATASPARRSTGKTYKEDDINSIISFGFSRAQAMKALDATDNNLERAADWIFTHPDELMDTNEAAPVAAAPTAVAAQAAASNNLKDGNGVYKLIGFVSHMGTNANVGHYVAHILKEGKWVIYNDENVALSENPPKDLAYLYLYKRVE